MSPQSHPGYAGGPVHTLPTMQPSKGLRLLRAMPQAPSWPKCPPLLSARPPVRAGAVALSVFICSERKLLRGRTFAHTLALHLTHCHVNMGTNTEAGRPSETSESQGRSQGQGSGRWSPGAETASKAASSGWGTHGSFQNGSWSGQDHRTRT